MPSVIDILERLESDNSRLFKEELLELNSRNKLLKRVFVSVGDPYVNYYINKFKMPLQSDSYHPDDDYVIEKFLNFITDQLSTRKITGNLAKETVISFFKEMSDMQRKWCLRILLKNLRCGVQNTTVNKIWPGSVKKFSVQLAETLATKFEKNKGIVILDQISYPVRVEPKLDGLRCIAVKHQGEVTLFTRNGTPLETLPSIKAALEVVTRDDFVLDGEIMGADWSESASVVMSHKKNKDDSNMKFHVFDSMNFSDWRDQINHDTLNDRVELTTELVKLVSSDKIVQVNGELVKDQSELLDFYVSSMENGYEGIMIKSTSSSYRFKRTDSILKLKPVTTYEGVIVGSYEGRRGSKREGLWGGFEVKLPNGIITRVGGGFTDQLKSEIQVNPKSFLGKIVELEGQPEPNSNDGLTKDGRIRFPVFIRFRDERDVDSTIVELIHN